MKRFPLRNASLAICALGFLVCTDGLSFDGHRVQEGSITLEIHPVSSPGGLGESVPVSVSVHNGGDEAVDMRLRLHGLADAWHPVEASSWDVRVEAGKACRHEFNIAVSHEVFRALYPVHVTASCREADGVLRSLHAVRILESTLSHRSSEPSVTAAAGPLRFQRTLRLDRRAPQIVWRYFDQPDVRQPAGWTGQEPVSRTSVHVGNVERGGQSRPTLSLHPPWFGGKGTVFAEYRVKLPAAKPLSLTFANAIRDQGKHEPASDGVTFRVWVDDQVVYQIFTDSKIWIEGSADLSSWAGRTVLLRLESHPGPALDTTCDSSFWGEPTVWCGPVPKAAEREPDRQAQLAEAFDLLRQSAPDPNDTRWFDLGGGHRAVYFGGAHRPSQRILGFAAGDGAVMFRGLHIEIDDRTLSGFDLLPSSDSTRFQDEKGAFSVDVSVWEEKGALKLHASASDGRRITDLSLGPADQQATHVYFGHGYAIRGPRAFRVSFGGHGLSTSHVGVDFANRVSLLTASDFPPVSFDVDPDHNRYALHTRGNATLTLVPGARGALDCAIRYRPLYDKPAAPGVAAKAGRFVFDLWGGRYRDHLEWMETAEAYGLTETLLTIHDWQRWGYDYRLPDIFPPNPGLGSVADLQALSDSCRKRGIPWGLHDNYIDFYPDAMDYSYDHICFSKNGEPVPAWLNEYRNAQSYRWRPDRILPFVRRNLAQLAPVLQPSHSFVDVFTSIPPIEFYDREGTFHDAIETRRHWSDAFDVIRETLAPPSITSSEAGHDQLTGHLDGADCQFLRLSAQDQPFTIALACEDWERVPWYDAVLHDRFALHGVGYSSRYQGGRPREQHGIESDDYLSAEILTGHALMTDRPAGLDGAVRAYWLAQPWARGVALDQIEAVAFDGDDLHRLIVRWASGAEARINRGREDWHTRGRILPPYGFLAVTDNSTCTVERIDGWVVEQSAWPGAHFVNTRTHFPRRPHAIRLASSSLEGIGDREFRLQLVWEAGQPLPRKARVFVHFLNPDADPPDRILFQGDHEPEVPTTEWTGTVRTGGQIIRIPQGVAPGRYPVVVGLFDSDGHRFALLGDDLGGRQYPVGTLAVSADAPPALETRPQETLAPPRTPHRTLIHFGAASTDGAFRLSDHGSHLQLTPLPGSPPMQVALRTARACPGRRVTSIHVLDRSGRGGPPVPWSGSPQQAVFTTAADTFAYRLQTTENTPAMD